MNQHSNIIPFPRSASRPAPPLAVRFVYIDRLDGTPWLGRGFAGAAPDAAWSWICGIVAAELSCRPDQIGHLDDADTVTVDGLPVYNIRIEPQTMWIAGRQAVIVDEWQDHETGRNGFDYRFVEDQEVHWIFAGDVRLGRVYGPVQLPKGFAEAFPISSASKAD